MPSGFSTEEFLAFSASNSGESGSAGILFLEGTEPFPYRIIQKANTIVPDGGKFIVSPICLSGAVDFEPDSDLDSLFNTLESENITGGFLQTRTPYHLSDGLIETASCYAYISKRTNYRISLGLSVEELLKNMKADSRSRSRKLLSNADRYEVTKVDSSDMSGIQAFSDMYSLAAHRLGFAPSYHFKQTDFTQLLQSTKWALYLLKCDSKVIAGCVICELDAGYDYTFMASQPDVNDVGRANLLFFYKYFSEQNKKGYLDLGGGIIENDSLARFKLGFGSTPLEFLRLRFVSKSCVGSISESDLHARLSTHWP